MCRRAPSRALAVNRTSSSSSSSSASTSANITATGKLVENEKNEIKKKKKEEEERENRNGALSTTTTTLERNEDNRLPGLMNVESFAKDTITSDVVSVHDYMEQVRVLFVRSFVRSFVCVCVYLCVLLWPCVGKLEFLCVMMMRELASVLGYWILRGLMCPYLGFVEFRCRFSWGMMEGLLAGFVLFSVLRLLMMPRSSSFFQVMCIIPSAQYLGFCSFFFFFLAASSNSKRKSVKWRLKIVSAS